MRQLQLKTFSIIFSAVSKFVFLRKKWNCNGIKIEKENSNCFSCVCTVVFNGASHFCRWCILYFSLLCTIKFKSYTYIFIQWHRFNSSSVHVWGMVSLRFMQSILFIYKWLCIHFCVSLSNIISDAHALLDRIKCLKSHLLNTYSAWNIYVMNNFEPFLFQLACVW